MSKSKILFLMTGSIACYKACSLISKLIQNGFAVQVAASSSALQFVGEATLEGLTGKSVVSDMYGAGKMMAHINLIRDCDLVICAPATAHYINRIAQGLGDDLLSTLFLAHDFEKPFLIAPAMNTKMYLHPVTQASLNKLTGFGVKILETASGVLACGEVGSGKLLDPDLIFDEIRQALTKKHSEIAPRTTAKPAQALKVLVTAGGTTEAIDDVRVISNRSTGRTGTLIANSLSELGLDVILLKANSCREKSFVNQEYTFESFEDLKTLLKSELATHHYDFLIHAAAVSDYSVEPYQGKISSENESLHLRLKRNPKLIQHFSEWSLNKNIQIIGFKLTSTTSTDERAQAVAKVLEYPNVRFVVQNDMNEIKTGHHIFRVFTQAGPKLQTALELSNVEQLASYLGQMITHQGVQK
jgi:phosphopantothenoylcysteine decarboxylase/phosphopantothenate--cysteine ligase